MIEKKIAIPDGRIWALRDRSKVPVNKKRGRAMRTNPTEAERKLWWHLRHRLPLPGSHFRRQVHIGHYIVDFVSHGHKIVIEIDGGQHAKQISRDVARTAFLRSKGYRVLRFWNNDVSTNIDGVIALIHSAVSSIANEGRKDGRGISFDEGASNQNSSSSHSLLTPTPTPPHKGEGNKLAP